MGLESSKQPEGVNFARRHSKFVIRELQGAVRGFIDNPKQFPTLNRRARRVMSAGLEKYMQQGKYIAFGKADNERDMRGMRRERRAACAAVMSAFLYIVDFKTATCRMGIMKVAKICGLHTRRIDRAIADLRAAGIMQTVRRPAPIITATGRRYFCAVRKINPNFLRVCLPEQKIADQWDKAGGRMPPCSAGIAAESLHRAAFAAHLRLPPKPPPGWSIAAGVMTGWINV